MGAEYENIQNFTFLRKLRSLRNLGFSEVTVKFKKLNSSSTIHKVYLKKIFFQVLKLCLTFKKEIIARVKTQISCIKWE